MGLSIMINYHLSQKVKRKNYSFKILIDLIKLKDFNKIIELLLTS
jgi:hypothetical protein